MPSHPKVAPLSDAAFRVHVTTLAWCVEHGTDGVVPRGVPATLTAAPRGKRMGAVIDELVTARLWIPANDVAGGWEIHDFLAFNPTAEKQTAAQSRHSAARREAGQRGAAARWSNGKPDGKRHGKPDGKLPSLPLANGWQTDASDSDSDSDQIPPTPQPSPKPAPDPQRPGLGGFEVEAFLAGVGDGVGSRPAPLSFLDRAHVTRGLAKCPLPPDADAGAIATWVRESAAAWSRSHHAAGKAQFCRGWHPAKWVEWLNAGCPDPLAAPASRQSAAAAPAPYHREWQPDADEGDGRGAA